MITFGKLKEKVKDIIAPKMQMYDDYPLTFDDLMSNKLFPIFKWNENPNLVVNGLSVRETECLTLDDIELIWQELDDIRINIKNKTFSCDSHSVILGTTSKYSLYSMSLSSQEKKMIKKYSGNVYPVYHLSTNQIASIEKKVLSISKNDTEYERSFTVTANYRNGKISKTDSVNISQAPNSISDWKLGEIVSNGIMFAESIKPINKDGGIVDLHVIERYNAIYVQEDSMGNRIAEKNDGVERSRDITDLCVFSTENTDGIKILGNHVAIEAQKHNSEERTFAVKAKYKDLSIATYINQSRGNKITYKEELYFLSTKNNKDNLELPTSLRCDGYIPFSYTKNMYIEDEFVTTFNTSFHQLSFDYNDKTVKEFVNDWLKIEVVEDASYGDGRGVIHFDIFGINKSKSEPRICEIPIYGEDEESILFLTVTQPCLKAIGTMYSLEVSGGDNYNLTNLPHAYVNFIPYIETIYEDKSVERHYAADDVHILYETTLDGNKGITPFSFIPCDFHGGHVLSFSVDPTNLPSDDYTFSVSGKLLNSKNECVSSTSSHSITYHPSKLVKTYVLKSEDNKYNWKGEWSDSITLPIQSMLYETYTDYDEETSMYCDEYKESVVDYTINSFDETCHFSVTKDGNVIHITPKTTNTTLDDITEELVITQKNSDKSIIIKLVHEAQEQKRILVNVKVEVIKENIDEEIVSSRGILFVTTDDKETLYNIQLNPCWLYPSIKNNADVVYQGYLELETNTNYNFDVRYFKITKPQMMSTNDYNFTETFCFNNANDNVLLQIKL